MSCDSIIDHEFLRDQLILYVYYISRFYMECLLPEIIDPQFPKRMLKSDIRDPDRIKKNIFKKLNK